MDPFILNLGIRWLQAVDAFSASCVSQEWRRFLSAHGDNGHLWKQICRNSGPSGIPNLESSTDYRRLAMGLRFRQVTPPPPSEEIYAPTTRPQDYFAIVDIYRRHEEANGKRRKETITSFVCPVEGTKFAKRNQQGEPILQGENPYSANMMRDSDEAREWRRLFPHFRQNFESAPFCYAAWKAVGGSWYSPYTHDRGSFLRFDLTLFRRDTGKSVRLIHDAAVKDSDSERGNMFLYPDSGVLNHAATDTGRMSRSLMNDRSVGLVEVTTAITLEPLLPSSGSDQEPQWLKNYRQATEEERRYEPNEEDMAVLSNIDHFNFGVEHFYMNLVMLTVAADGIGNYDAGWYEFQSQDEFLIILEGLCWE